MSTAVVEKSPDDIVAQISRFREIRKNLAKQLAQAASVAVAHIENGSFEVVEEALMNCQAGICEMKETIKTDKKKRRARKHDTTAQTSQAG